ncbi:hypothetical protein ACHAPC_000783 [Botrytis cinerea]
MSIGYEDEAPESYYTNFRDETYSPSPPHASGGSYYPENNAFPPPPTSNPETFTNHGNKSTPFVNEIPPIPPYNPQDYASQRPTTHDPHHYPPSSRVPGDNVSTHQSSNPEPFMTVPPHTREESYFPFHETSPPQTDHVYDREDRLNVPTPSTPDTPLTPIEATPSNKSVMFAPLSPTSSRRLERIRNSKADQSTSTVNTYEQPNPSSDRRYRRRRRRNSDPSSDRPSRPRKHRKHRKGRHSDESDSEKSEDEEVEVLPARFDKEGRPLSRDRSGSRERDIAKEFGGGNEMVERVVRGVGEVVAGKQTWSDLLMGFVKDGGLAGGSTRGSVADFEDEERESRRERKERRASRSRARDRDRDRDREI